MDKTLMIAFVSIPASKRHHHSYPRGLLTHSLQCALITMQNMSAMNELTQSEREVTLVAALLHDVGKPKH